MAHGSVLVQQQGDVPSPVRFDIAEGADQIITGDLYVDNGGVDTHVQAVISPDGTVSATIERTGETPLSIEMPAVG